MARGTRAATSASSDAHSSPPPASSAAPAAPSTNGAPRKSSAPKRKRRDQSASPTDTKKKRTTSQDGMNNNGAEQTGSSGDIHDEFGSDDADDKMEVDPDFDKYGATDEPLDDSDDTSGPLLEARDAHELLSILRSAEAAHGLHDVLDESFEQDDHNTSLAEILKDSSPIDSRALRRRIHAQAQVLQSTSRRKAPADLERLALLQFASRLLDKFVESTASVTGYIDGTLVNKDDNVKPRFSGRTNPTKVARYALYQHLPTGDYFTSAEQMDRTEIKSLEKGLSNVLLVTPAPSIPALHVPILDSLVSSSTAKPHGLYTSPPQKISSGSFIDYGYFSSLGPNFMSEGNGPLGREAMGMMSLMRKDHKLRQVAAIKAIQGLGADNEATKEVEAEGESIDPSNPFVVPQVPQIYMKKRDAIVAMAKELLPTNSEGGPSSSLTSEEVELLVAALDEQELEERIGVVLTKNARALERLQSLQESRYRKGIIIDEKSNDTSAASRLKADSEEWKLAQSIIASLASIAELRPRVKQSLTGSPLAPSLTDPSLLPSSTFLHALQRSIPREATPGWRGTLIGSRDYALVDNTTLRSTGLHVPQSSVPPPAGATSSTTAQQNAQSARQSPMPTFRQYIPPGQAPPPPSTPSSLPQRAPVQMGMYFPGGYAAGYVGQHTPLPQGQMHQMGMQNFYPQGGYQSGFTPMQRPGMGATLPAASKAIPNQAFAPRMPSSPMGTGGLGGPMGLGMSPAPALPPHLRRLPGTPGAPASPVPASPGFPGTPSPTARRPA